MIWISSILFPLPDVVKWKFEISPCSYGPGMDWAFKIPRFVMA
jgi:hypothetical protein